MPGKTKSKKGSGCGSCKVTKGGKSLKQLKSHVGALRKKVGSGKRNQRKSKKGGVSDYLMVHNSRGPVNTPDIGWSNGLSNFRQFTKTGEYIPNSKLVAAAAPIFSGVSKDLSVPPTGHAYDPHASTLGSLTGGKRKKKTTTKKRKVVRRKKTTTKKKKTTKKKTTTKPKRKTSTKKRKVVKRKTSKKKRTTKPKRKTTTKKRTTTRRKKKTTKKKSLFNRVRSALSL
tara:strand:+ start:1100 stop:1783 length:684 start_codon:yes stop_codon:yes gene_type:complete